MTLELLIRAPGGAVERLPLDGAQARVQAEPGHRYSLVAADGAPIDARILRVGDDLVVEGLPEGRSLDLAGFFSACTPQAPCELGLEGFSGAERPSIDPASEPIAAFAAGGFLMHAAPTAASAATTAAGAGAGDPADVDGPGGSGWMPIAAVAGGVALLGAALGGGGGGDEGIAIGTDRTPGPAPAPVAPPAGPPADTTPPATPTLVIAERNGASTALLNAGDLRDGLALTGTAEAGSTVVIDLLGAAGASGRFSAVAGSDGSYTLTIRSDELPGADGAVSLSASATDTAGNTSAATSVTTTFDRTLSGPAPSIANILDDRAPGVGEVVAGAPTNDPTPTLVGTLSAPLAADESLVVLRNGRPAGTATIADTQFRFTDDLTGIDGTYEYSMRLVDTAGNAVESSAFALQVDATAPTQQPSVSGFVDVLGRNVPLPAQGITFDDTPSIRVTLDDVLGPGETLRLLRTVDSTRDEVLVGTATTPGRTVFDFDDRVAAPDNVRYQAQVVDATGLEGPLSATYVFTVLPLSSINNSS